jgi:hypothetical protein
MMVPPATDAASDGPSSLTGENTREVEPRDSTDSKTREMNGIYCCQPRIM